MDLPKYQKSNNTGRSGLTVVTKIVESDLNWIVRPNHQENDFGIDAYIDIVTNESITGKSIAIQVKAGRSYLIEANKFNWKFKGELKHLNYYLNHDIPVLIILVDVEKEIAYWEICKPEHTNRQGQNWTMLIPKKQQITLEYKDELLKYVSQSVDYVAQLEQYWSGNKILSESGRINLIAGKDDIHKMNYEPLIHFMERVCSNKELLFQLREKVEIGIHGYDNDPRELNQIEEVRKWIKNSVAKVPGLSYFLVNDKYAQFIKLFMFSIIDIEYIPEGNHYENGILRRKVEFNSKELVKVFSILFSDLNDFTRPC